MAPSPSPRPESATAAALAGPEALGRWVARTFAGEIAHRTSADLDAAPLCHYYPELAADADRTFAIGAHAYVKRLWPLVELLAGAPAKLRVLDAGCGLGTESYLMALLGHSVTGVDLVDRRIAMARSRLPYFTTLDGAAPDVSFVNANLFTFLERHDPFDVVWVMEAISHIYPPDRFLALVRRALANGGRLVVSDANRANPLKVWRSWSIRGSLVHRPHTHYRDPETGAAVEFGRELITTPRGLTRMLGRTGFEVQALAMSGFSATTVLPRRVLDLAPLAAVVRRTADILPRIPLLRSFGSVYTLVAAKRGSA